MKIFGYEITFIKTVKPKQQKPKAKGFTSKKWATRDIDILVKMTKAGYPDVEIAKTLNRTTTAIFSKRYKLKEK